MKALAKRNGSAVINVDLSSRSSVERFRQVAKAFTVQATQSKQKARTILISEGIYTKSGRLSKNYV